jgi:hypothetical protein
VAQAHELVDVELVVGEQHEVLEPLGRGAGVVAQAVQRIVHPRRGEQRQRLRLAGRARGAVGNAVVHGGQVGQVEHVAHQQRRSALSVPSTWSCSANEKCTGMGCVLVPTSSSTPWLLQQQAELLQVVVGVQVGAGQRGLVAAGPATDQVTTEIRRLARAEENIKVVTLCGGVPLRGQLPAWSTARTSWWARPGA